ncbi:unnamed protein product [Ectocarpus sp. 6 AP-2014]
MNDRDDRRAEVDSRHSASGSTPTSVPDSSSNSSEPTEPINSSTSGEPEVSAASDATGTGTDAETSTAVEVEICPTCHQEVPKNNDTSASAAATAPAVATAAAAASPGAPNKRKADHTADECEPRAPKRRACVDRSKPRARLTLGQKLEILDLLDQKKMSRVEIAAIYKCSDRTVSSCSVNRTILEAEAASSTRKLKSKGRRSAGFPECQNMANGFRIGAPAPAVSKRANQVVSLAGATTPRAKAIALFVFVRDSIKFGFTSRFDAASPEETLEAGMGHCNPQGALFASLLQAQGIPARQRFVNLSNGVLRGVLSPPPARLLHSYVEVQLDGQVDGGPPDCSELGQDSLGWIRVDGYIADPALFHAARARLVKENMTEGYGVHVNGVNEWDGTSDSFCQMAEETTQVTETFEAFDEPGLFYSSPENFQRLPWPVRLIFGWIVKGPNSSIDAIRAEFAPPSVEK